MVERISFERGGKAVGGFAGVPDSGQTLAQGQTLPIAERSLLLFARVINSQDVFVRTHRVVVTGPAPIGCFLIIRVQSNGESL